VEPLERLIDAAKRGDLEGVRAIAEKHPELLHGKDETGATALHYAAFDGRQEIAELLVKMGADVNARDDRFRATPAGWAIEYLREMGGLLGIELEDFAFAIRRSDAAWVERFLRRFPRLREEKDRDGKLFRSLAAETENVEIMRFFDDDVTR
jgi:ankyrin repeat protein